MSVSLEEVKEYLRVEGAEEDALLDGFIVTVQNNIWMMALYV